MILSKQTIRGKSNVENPLIDKFEDSGLCNSSYKVRIGKLVVPHSGLIIEKKQDVKRYNFWDKICYYVANFIAPSNSSSADNNLNDSSDVFQLRPREIVLFETVEQISMPNNLMGSYTGLNTISQKGILLINASVVEPEYKGPLSGILVNFSSKNVELKLGMQIAKICFHQLDHDVAEGNNIINESDYTKDLVTLAKENYTETFLDIKTILNEVEARMTKKLKRQAYLAGFLVAVLLFIGTIEPFVYNAFWGHTSVNEWQKMNDIEILDSLRSQQQTLIKEIDKLKNAKK